MDLNELLNGIAPGAYLEIFMQNGDGECGILKSIDEDGKALVLNSFESGDDKAIAIDQIALIRDVSGEDEEIPKKSIKEQIQEIPMGKYLMVWGNFGRAINETCEQGKLTQVGDTFFNLTSTTYPDRVESVSYDKVTSIDTSRERSGALGSVQTPDLRNVGGTWYRGNTEVGSPGYEQKKAAGQL